MKMTPKRFGNAEVVSPKTGMDSSHGKATATPAPRRTARREMRSENLEVRFGILITFRLGRFRASFIPKLVARYDDFHQRGHVVAVGIQFRLHTLNRGLVRQD